MTRTIDTLARAARHGMIVQAECTACGNVRHFNATDLSRHFGGGRDPLTLRFECRRCRPEVKVRVIEIDHDRRPAITVWVPQPAPDGGRLRWVAKRLR